MKDKKKTRIQLSAELASLEKDIKKLDEKSKRTENELKEQLENGQKLAESRSRIEQIINRELHEEIEERKLLEKALELSENRFRRLFEAARDGILILDFETGNIEEVNPFLVELLGYAREHFLGKKLWEIGAFKDIEISKSAFNELQTKGYVRYEDLPLQTKDARLVEVEFVSNVYLVGHKKVIQCNIRDISLRKRQEKKP